MTAVQRGLGRGLDALFKGYQHEDVEDDAPRTSEMLPINSIMPNPEQPRKHFSEEGLQELADSIRSQGVLQPLLVRPAKGHPRMYEIIAGERRWRACQRIGLTQAPVIIRNMTDEETLAVALIENLQREDLNPMEEALGMAQLKEQFGMNQDTLATRLGKSRSAVANTLRLLQLPELVQENIANGALSAGHARALLAISDETDREQLRQHILEQGASVRDAELQAAYWKKHGSLPQGEPLLKRPAKSAPSHAPQAPNKAMAELLKQLQTAVPGTATLTGTEDKGKLTFAFHSREELADFLALLDIRF